MLLFAANADPCAGLLAAVIQMVWVPGAMALHPALMATVYSCVTVLGACEKTWIFVTWHDDHVFTCRNLLRHLCWAIMGLWGLMARDFVCVVTGEELGQDDHAGGTFLMAQFWALVIQAAQGLGTRHLTLVFLVLRVTDVALFGTGMLTVRQWLATHLLTPTLRALDLKICPSLYGCKLVWVILTAKGEGWTKTPSL